MRRLKTALHAALVALVAAVAFSFGFTPIRADNDVWWHLKTGRLIVETRALPTIDPLNHAAEADGVVWHNHEWLTQVAAWGVFRAGEAAGLDGFLALIFAKALLLAATYVALALFAGRVSGSLLAGVVAALLAAEIGRRTFYARPPVVTYALLVGLYATLHAVRVGWLRARWLVVGAGPLFALWANLHGGWAAGIVLMAAFGGGAVLEAAGSLWRRAPIADYGARVVRASYPWVAAILLALAGTLVNPAGIHLYDMFAIVLGDEFLMASIGELQPPPIALSAAFFATLPLLFVLAASVPRRFPFAAEFLFVPFFAWQAIHHWRHLTLFGLLMAPALAWLLAEALRGLPKGIAGMARIGVVVVAVLGSLHAVALRSEGGTYLERNATLLRGTSFLAENFPAAEAEFLLAARLPGRLFNLDHYAGYLIWALAPAPYQVSSDSRFDVFGSRYAREAAAIMATAPGWRERLAARGVNLVLIPTEPGRGRLAAELARDPDWACVYYRVAGVRDDDGAVRARPEAGWVIFARATPAAAARIDDARRLFESIRPAWAPSDLFGYVPPPPRP